MLIALPQCDSPEMECHRVRDAQRHVEAELKLNSRSADRHRLCCKAPWLNGRSQEPTMAVSTIMLSL